MGPLIFQKAPSLRFMNNDRICFGLTFWAASETRVAVASNLRVYTAGK